MINHLLDYFLERIDDSGDCWIWTGARTKGNYGSVNCGTPDGRVKTTAIRVSYMLFCGDIKPGYAIDHLCLNRICVNPDHLELVTYKENNNRAQPISDVCAHGHTYTKENTYYRLDGRGRMCRRCQKIRKGLAYA